MYVCTRYLPKALAIATFARIPTTGTTTIDEPKVAVISIKLIVSLWKFVLKLGTLIFGSPDRTTPVNSQINYMVIRT